MKKIKLSFVAILIFVGFGNGINAQVVEQGDMIVDGFYGFPNLFGSILKTSYANSGSATGVKVQSFGPIGGKFEYMASDKLGIGLDVNYSKSGVTYSDLDTTGVTNYDYEVYASTVRAMLIMNFHFGSSDVLDSYAIVGAGYRNRQYGFKSNDPDFGNNSVSGINPIAFRLGVGIRYFLSDNIGIGAEVATSGGGVLRGMLTFKF